MELNRYLSPESESSGPKVRHSVASVVSLASSLAGTALLAYAILHVRVDRSSRIPVETYLGPVASWVPYLAFAGWGLSFVALMLAVTAMKRKGSWIAPAVFAACLSVLTLLGSCSYWGCMMET